MGRRRSTEGKDFRSLASTCGPWLILGALAGCGPDVAFEVRWSQEIAGEFVDLAVMGERPFVSMEQGIDGFSSEGERVWHLPTTRDALLTTHEGWLYAAGSDLVRRMDSDGVVHREGPGIRR